MAKNLDPNDRWPVGPDCFGGSDEDSHYMLQERIRADRMPRRTIEDYETSGDAVYVNARTGMSFNPAASAQPFKVPTPAQMRDQIEAAQGPQVEAALRRIFGEAQQEMGKSGTLRAFVALHPGEWALRRGLEVALHKAGWSATFRDDQRDGAHVEIAALSPSPMDR